MSQLTVSLGDNSYDILIDSDILKNLGRYCTERGLNGRAAVVTNPTVAALYADGVLKSLTDAGNSVTLIEIPDGEEYKNSSTLNSVYDALIEGESTGRPSSLPWGRGGRRLGRVCGSHLSAGHPFCPGADDAPGAG